MPGIFRAGPRPILIYRGSPWIRLRARYPAPGPPGSPVPRSSAPVESSNTQIGTSTFSIVAAESEEGWEKKKKMTSNARIRFSAQPEAGSGRAHRCSHRCIDNAYRGNGSRTRGTRGKQRNWTPTRNYRYPPARVIRNWRRFCN